MRLLKIIDKLAVGGATHVFIMLFLLEDLVYPELHLFFPWNFVEVSNVLDCDRKKVQILVVLLHLLSD